MKEPRLRLTPKKYIGDTSIISIRVPKDMLKDLDQVAAETGRNRSEVITTSLEFALKHMEIVNEETID